MLRAASNERVYTYVHHERIEHTLHNDSTPKTGENLGAGVR